MSGHSKIFSAPPSVLAYMSRALLPSSGWNAERGFADLRMNWRGYRLDANARDGLRRFASRLSETSIELLLPHITGFRLSLAMLAKPAWPLPIWSALQIRNRLLLHRSLEPSERFDLGVEVGAWRVLEKGLEVDLHAKLQQGSACAWESVVTFYYRGRFGPPAQHGTALGAGQDQPLIDDQAGESARWRIDGGGRWKFCVLTGDYNGIHQSNWYARRFGFRAAFPHPQRVAAQCLAHLPAPAAVPQQLDLWIKGPAYFGSEVVQKRSQHAKGEGCDFALFVDSDTRPALVGKYCAGLSS